MLEIRKEMVYRFVSSLRYSKKEGGDPMDKMRYVCPKCGCTQYETDQFQATGGNFAKIFDVQNKKFVTVSCSNCGYTELYKAQSSTGWNVLDFLVGN
mgnify:CR=1